MTWVKLPAPPSWPCELSPKHRRSAGRLAPSSAQVYARPPATALGEKRGRDGACGETKAPAAAFPASTCPLVSRPQQRSTPATTAQAWFSPEARTVAPDGTLATAGTDWALVLPIPSCPESLAPKHWTAPPVSVQV